MRGDRAFTLLEIMVAMAILAMGLTTILSSQTGLFAATRRVQNETVAASLIRCKMSELEMDLERQGFPLIDQSESGPCCEDEGSEFTCEWKVETIELPQPAEFDMEGGEDEGLEDVQEESAALDLSSPNPALGAAFPLAGPGMSGVENVGDVAGVLGESSDEAAAQGGIVGMALSMAYPTLKPMLEASIRKITVRILWHEGEKEKDFQVIQYVTNPLEGSLNPNAAEGIGELAEMLGQGTLGATSGAGENADSGPDSTGVTSP